MDTAVLSTLSALSGTVIGAISSLGTTWMTTKAQARAARIVHQVTGASVERAEAALAAAGGSAKVAIVTLETGITPDEARQRLNHAGGFLRRALAEE